MVMASPENIVEVPGTLTTVLYAAVAI